MRKSTIVATLWMGLILMLTGPVVAQSTSAPASAPGGEFVWWEAERFFHSTFPKSNPFAPKTEAEKAALSEGAWIGTWEKRKGAIALVYNIEVPSDGQWRFYARKFYKHGPYRWRFDDQEWTNVGKDVALLDDFYIRPTICVNWTSAGLVNLKAGRHSLRIEATDNESAIAFDCFILTKKPFLPRGPLKPGVKSGDAPPGWFVFDPDADSGKSPIDLGFLNEPSAGENGFIQPRNGKMVQEKTGKPVRFWGVNAGPDILGLEMMDLDDLAALLARRGVNMVRLHAPVFFNKEKEPDFCKTNPKALARLFNVITAFKKRGIYCTLSIYYPLWLKFDASTGWPGYRNQNPFAILFWDETMQAIHRSWWKDVLTTPNPHTGVALKDEPAVLSCEIQNEDSIFFWTFSPYNQIPEQQMQPLEMRFAKWLANRYGSRDEAIRQWKTRVTRGDAPEEGRIGLLDVGSIAIRRDLRAKDTAEFLTELESDFYASTRKWMREELGVKSMISGSNWMTANGQYLTPLERLANCTCDLIDHHGYYSGQHDGPRASYAVDAGDRYTDRSFLKLELDKHGESSRFVNPIFDTQYNDLPTMISELSWTDPNRFRGEQPLLCAAYGALQDVDALGFFALAGPGWQRSMTIWPIQTASELGQYPAAALIYRQGLVDEGPVIAQIELQKEAIKSLAGQPVVTVDALTDLKLQKVAPGQLVQIESNQLDPRLPMLGRVVSRFVDHPSRTLVGDIRDLVDEDAKQIISATRQIILDHGNGLLMIDSPRAQSVVGFLSAKKSIELAEVRIESTMEFGSISLVPLDGKPLAQSARMLLQVSSEQQLSGFETTATSGSALKTIKSLGRAPYLVRELAGTVLLKHPGSRLRITRLSQNGDAIGAPEDVTDRIELQKDVLYYLLTR